MVAGGPGEGEEVEQSSVEGVSSASSGSTVNAQGHKKGQAAQKKAPPPEPPQDHYYFYPKMDPNVSQWAGFCKSPAVLLACIWKLELPSEVPASLDNICCSVAT